MKKEKYYLALERLFQNENNCSQKKFHTFELQRRSYCKTGINLI